MHEACCQECRQRHGMLAMQGACCHKLTATPQCTARRIPGMHPWGYIPILGHVAPPPHHKLHPQPHQRLGALDQTDCASNHAMAAHSKVGKSAYDMGKKSAPPMRPHANRGAASPQRHRVVSQKGQN